MPDSKFTYELPSARDSSVVREDTIEYAFIGTLQDLDSQTFHSTRIPVCLWFLRENGNASAATFGLN